METKTQLQLIAPYELIAGSAEKWAHAITDLRLKYDVEMGPIETVTYDSKTDRYIAHFYQGKKGATIKLSGPVAVFLLAHLQNAKVAGQHFLIMDESGTAVDCLRVTL